MAVNSVAADALSASSATKTKTNIASSSYDQFMKMMLSELTQQDPLKPMTTSELAQQMLSLKQVETSDSLQSKLSSLGHSLMLGASHLIGKNVSVLDPATGLTVTGSVQSLRSLNGEFQLVINGQPYSSEMVQELR